MARRKTTRLAFDALIVEGALIAPDMIADVAALKATAQSEADYRIPPGLKLRDEIGRSWRIAEALWARFSQALAGGPPYAATQAFVDELLRQVFGFSSLEAVAVRQVGSRMFSVRRVALGGRIPIAVAPAGEGLDRGLDQFAEEHRKRSASLFVQELLNADEAASWGIATDGLKLRLLRDNASLTRPAYVEADLERIFRGGLYADFVAVWLLIHESRFGASDALPSDCPLERWREAGREAGAKARDRLGVGVEAALKELGAGFVEHPANGVLRDAIEGGALTSQSLYEELLRLVYRLIFLFTTEDRGLLHDPTAGEAVKALYANGYSAARLRNQAARRVARDANHDLYEGLKIVFRSLWHGEKVLGLPALGGLFRGATLPNLGDARISNKRLLEAVFRLAWITEDHTLMRVNWRDMETEELGSVYEALLELPPRINLEARSFFFAEGAETSGNARKRSSSYYTPDSLVQLLLDRALDPVIDRTVNENSERAVEALLELSIIDPACGSGHFLLAAGRRLATRVAQLRSPGAPSAEDWRHALREVARCCLFGVDRNPMAVELCQTALWIESVDPGKPLTLLEGHVQCGDSLIGVWDLSGLAGGIPDEAYKPFIGDEKVAAAGWRKLNKVERDRPLALPFSGPPPALVAAARAVDNLPEDEVGQVEVKASRLADFHRQTDWRSLKAACDLYVAAFFVPKIQPPDRYTGQTLPTTRVIWDVLEGGDSYAGAIALAADVSDSIHAFHWPLAFPQVSARGGFDVVLGNPPWDTMSPDAKEFFSPYDGAVRFMSPDDQKRRIDELKAQPDAQSAWDAYSRHLYCAANFMKESGRYQLFSEGNLGKGDFNVYRMFAETAFQIARNGGYAAQFVPEGFYKGANAAALRTAVFNLFDLKLLVGFVNTRAIWFPSVHQQFEFCLYVAEKGGKTNSFTAAFRVNSHEKLTEIVAGHDGLRIPLSMVSEFSPDAMAIMEFGAQDDIDICRKMYQRYPRFGEKIEGLPYRTYMAEIHMGNNRDLFVEDSDGLPVFEGRMLDVYDYRAKGYASGRGRSADWVSLAFGSAGKSIQPQWYIPNDCAPNKILDRINTYRIGFCDVVNPTTEKCLISALIPPETVCGHSVLTILFEEGGMRDSLLWIGIANSLAMDFIVRKKVRLHMTYTILDTLPFPRNLIETNGTNQIVRRVYALCAVGKEMDGFRQLAQEQFGDDTPQPTEDYSTRERLAAEINVLVASKVYGLTKKDVLYILDPRNVLGPDCGIETFSVLQNREAREFGEYRTQRLILEAWGRMERGELGDTTARHMVADPVELLTLPDGAWARRDRNLAAAAQATLAAVLKALHGPAPTRLVRQATVLSLEPRALLHRLTPDERIQWRRVVGTEAEPLHGVKRLVQIDNAAWREATVQLRATGRLQENLGDDTWAAGTGLEVFPTAGWADGRAQFVLSILLRAAADPVFEDAEIEEQISALAG
jgi:N-6 DNA Methylase